MSGDNCFRENFMERGQFSRGRFPRGQLSLGAIVREQLSWGQSSKGQLSGRTMFLRGSSPRNF